ncbi:undecaprenyl-diphosphate phosphatase [Hoyosella altamirensis]|nr:undecaprenyl-diphosphate phosphatase [Hoyosella altamirensis]
MSWLQVLVLSMVQGLTEFLPVSSSGHLLLAGEVFFGADAGASFTAVCQLGTEAAVVVYFARDIARIVRAWIRGIFIPSVRKQADYRLGWLVIAGSLPIGVLGFFFRDDIRTVARNLWLVAAMLIVAGVILGVAEYAGRKQRELSTLTLRDTLVMGTAQAAALIPGVSRSGGTISAGLFLGLSRYAAARYSFLLAIPAVVASGLFSLPDALSPQSSGLTADAWQLSVSVGITFVVGYACIAFFLAFVQRYSMYWFVGYRIIVGGGVLMLLGTGTISAS